MSIISGGFRSWSGKGSVCDNDKRWSADRLSICGLGIHGNDGKPAFGVVLKV